MVLTTFGGKLQADDVSRGADTAGVLQRAAEGAPIRLAVFGGSITLAGEGWIGDWLRKEFPRSEVAIQNAGLGGTGSELGVFRLGRDVIDFRPNVVFIEFCVNDTGLTDEEITRNLESIITRLRAQPEPPGIVLLIAAKEDDGLSKEPIHALAKNYGLLEIDLDEALREHLTQAGLKWTDLMKDAVHPNATGHAFYTQVISDRLGALLKAPSSAPESADKPTLLSRQPLYTDSAITPIDAAPGWMREEAPKDRKYDYFQGLISAEKPGTTLNIAFRGTEVGLLFPTNKSYGSIYASVDGGVPHQIVEGNYDGYGYVVLERNLSPGEHTLSLVVPAGDPGEDSSIPTGPAKLGYLLTASSPGQAPVEQPSEIYTSEILAALRFQAVPGESYIWRGPFTEDKKRMKADIRRTLPYEEESIRGVFTNPAARWSSLPPGATARVDLAQFSPFTNATAFFLATQIIVPSEGPALLRLAIKGRRKMWLNGQPIPDRQPGSDSDEIFMVPVTLQAGVNTLLWKVGSVRDACNITAAISSLSGEKLEFASPSKAREGLLTSY